MLMYNGRMTIQELRKHHEARPFRSFDVLMADGRALHVAHPEFLSQSQSGRCVYISLPDDTHETVDLLLVTALRLAGNKKASRSGAKQR